MAERFGVLRQFPWPTVTAAGLAGGVRWLTIIVALAAITWLVFVLTQRSSRPGAGETAVGAEK
jgi:Na+-transporting NADH:ubiquinone oxidoreductase subunit NqrE